MKIWLICSVLFFNYLIYHTYAQHAICNSIEGYDTKSLVKDYSQVMRSIGNSSEIFMLTKQVSVHVINIVN